jgi:hypothetical protein
MELRRISFKEWPWLAFLDGYMAYVQEISKWREVVERKASLPSRKQVFLSPYLWQYRMHGLPSVLLRSFQRQVARAVFSRV